jgi:hypothetical protein
LLRSTSTPANTTTSGAAAELAATAMPDLLSTLGPLSAGAALLARGMQLVLGNAANINVPAMTAAATGAAFLEQGRPIGIYQYDASGGLLLAPRKLAAAAVFTRELLSHSTPSVEELVRDIITRSIALALDKQIFGNSAGTVSTPPGLLNGVSALSATAGGTADALRIDIGNLANAVAAVGGLNIVFVADPKSAMKLYLARSPSFQFDILVTGAFSTPTVACFAVDAIASVTTGGVRIESTNDAAIQFDDAPGQNIVDSGVTGTVRSLWQADMVATRIVFDTGWGLRVPTGAVAYVQSPSW